MQRRYVFSRTVTRRQPDSERYKAIGVGAPIDKRATLRGFTSPDGVHWQTLDQDPILIAPDDPWPMFDSQQRCILGYACKTSTWHMHGVGYHSRLVGIPPIRSESSWNGIGKPEQESEPFEEVFSDDFRHWSEPEFIDLGDSPTEHLLQKRCTQYFRAPSYLPDVSQRFVPDRKFDPDWTASGLSEGVFMTSRDGVHWDRRFMEPFLGLGSDPNNWTDRNQYIGGGRCANGPAEMSGLFYGALPASIYPSPTRYTPNRWICLS